MLLQAKMSKVFWAEAVHTTFHIVNRSPTSTIDLRLRMRSGQVNPLTIHTCEYLGVQIIIMLLKESLNQGLKRLYS